MDCDVLIIHWRAFSSQSVSTSFRGVTVVRFRAANTAQGWYLERGRIATEKRACCSRWRFMWAYNRLLVDVPPGCGRGSVSIAGGL